MQPGRIFTINPKGEIRRSSGVLIAGGLATLSGINELVNEVFPPRGGKASSLQEFSDATFWRPTFGIGLIDSDEEEEALKRTAQAWPPLKGVSRSTAA